MAEGAERAGEGRVNTHVVVLCLYAAGSTFFLAGSLLSLWGALR
jgi:hypothetical protein